LVSIITRHR